MLPYAPDEGLANIFCKCPDNTYLGLWAHQSVITTQVCRRDTKAAIGGMSMNVAVFQ